MTRPIEERVLSIMLDRDGMTLEELRAELDHDTAIPYIIEHFIRLGYVRREEDTYSMTKTGRICIESVNQASKVSR
ncbi:helix-turn-helix domain-containing protein [Methanolobus sp.]|uniref:MarR family transcriptional regulator n=1 Tax=Methanolobus sp. TaxID=1874737 RepID=UPI0025F87C40|nr:helix-turn-helix domain-containing protein [Methanolobus sp.]